MQLHAPAQGMRLGRGSYLNGRVPFDLLKLSRALRVRIFLRYLGFAVWFSVRSSPATMHLSHSACVKLASAVTHTCSSSAM